MTPEMTPSAEEPGPPLSQEYQAGFMDGRASMDALLRDLQYALEIKNEALAQAQLRTKSDREEVEKARAEEREACLELAKYSQAILVTGHPNDTQEDRGIVCGLQHLRAAIRARGEERT